MCSSKSNTGSQESSHAGALQTELQPRGCREQQEGGVSGARMPGKRALSRREGVTEKLGEGRTKEKPGRAALCADRPPGWGCGGSWGEEDQGGTSRGRAAVCVRVCVREGVCVCARKCVCVRAVSECVCERGCVSEWGCQCV